MKKIKVWSIDHAIEIIDFDNMWERFHMEFGELKALTFDEDREPDTFETLGDFLNRKEITLEQLVEFLNRNKDNPDEYYFAADDYWFQEFLNEYGITRYALEKDYGLRQSTTNNILKNKTPFDNIQLSTAYALALAADMTISELVEKYRGR